MINQNTQGVESVSLLPHVLACGLDHLHPPCSLIDNSDSAEFPKSKL